MEFKPSSNDLLASELHDQTMIPHVRIKILFIFLMRKSKCSYTGMICFNTREFIKFRYEKADDYNFV